MTSGPLVLDSVVRLQSVGKVFPARIGPVGWLHKPEPIAALGDITLRASGGEVVALMGPNGAGKSTLLKLIAATLLPDSGRVVVLGFDTATHALAVRRAVALAVAQERSFFPRLTAYENLCFFAALDNVPRHRRRQHLQCVLEQSGLAGLRDRYVHQFSSGMYQRLAIARALLKKPSVLLLDEPARSADAETTELLRQLVRALAAGGTTIFLATHNFEEAANVADTAVLLSQGRLVDRLRRPDAASLRSAYMRLSPQPLPEPQWEVCRT